MMNAANKMKKVKVLSRRMILMDLKNQVEEKEQINNLINKNKQRGNSLQILKTKINKRQKLNKKLKNNNNFRTFKIPSSNR